MDKSGQKCNVAALFISYYLRVITSHYPRIISGNNKALFKKYRMWRRHIKYCQPKETPKIHIE
ncbi:hypothetical protein TRECRb3_17170 [Escherichia coli]|nr:hypothetical protein TRECRb3_17170 [Escherichia coli]